MLVADPQPWRERWQQGTTGWDLGAPHRLTRELIALARSLGRWPSPPLIVYIPGAGRAHDALEFTHEGCTVVAADFAPEAIAAARHLYAGVAGIQFAVEDVLTVDPIDVARYDVVFDRAMLCALDPPLREAYVRALAQRLKPGGLFLGLPFLRVLRENSGRPPFEISPHTVTGLFAKEFDLVALETRTDGHCDEVIGAEMLAIFQRRVAGG